MLAYALLIAFARNETVSKSFDNSTSASVSGVVGGCHRSCDLALVMELGRVDAGLIERGVAEEELLTKPESLTCEATNDSQAEFIKRFWTSFKSWGNSLQRK